MKINKILIGVLLMGAMMFSACKAKDEPSVDAPEDSQQEGEVISDDTESAEDESQEGTEDESQEASDTLVKMSLLDTEAMLENLGSYLLRPEDLPNAYLIPADGEHRVATIGLIQEMGEIEAKTYVKETGRIDGWWLKLQRTNKADFSPVAFESSIELFDSIHGAQDAVSAEYAHPYVVETRDYSPVDSGCDFGNDCEFLFLEEEDPAIETVVVKYSIAFWYKNAFVWVSAQGFTFDMDADYFYDAAKSVFDKLESAPTE